MLLPCASANALSAAFCAGVTITVMVTWMRPVGLAPDRRRGGGCPSAPSTMCEESSLFSPTAPLPPAAPIRCAPPASSSRHGGDRPSAPYVYQVQQQQD